MEGQITQLLAVTPGQILITLPGVAEVRAAAFAAHSLPITRFPTPEHLYAATGLAPTTWQSASRKRRGHISRQGLPEHRDALMGIAWGLSQHSPSFRERDAELRSRGMRPIQARVAHPGPRGPGPPRLPALLCPVDNPAALRRSALSCCSAQPRAVTAFLAMAYDGAT